MGEDEQPINSECMSNTKVKTESSLSWARRMFRLLFPLPPPEPVWRGKCECCKKDVTADYVPDGDVVCFGCHLGLTIQAKKREEDRHQIDLYKRAIRELEAEKRNKTEAEASSLPNRPSPDTL